MIKIEENTMYKYDNNMVRWDIDMMESIEKHNKELEAIVKISQILTLSFDLEKNMEAFLNILSNQFNMQKGCFFLVEPDTKKIRTVSLHGATIKNLMRNKGKSFNDALKDVVNSGNPHVLPINGASFPYSALHGTRIYRKDVLLILSPVIHDGEVLGVMGVDRIYSGEKNTIDDDFKVLTLLEPTIAQYLKLWAGFRKKENECTELKSQLIDRYRFANIIGESAPFLKALKSAKMLSGTDAPVLIIGEAGTGKETIARAIHYNSSRAESMFVPVNLAALPENVIETELFGMEKGVYKGVLARRPGKIEQADGGTLFLDEIADISKSLQVRMLQMMEEKTMDIAGKGGALNVDVRLVAATGMNLLHELKKGRMKEDLYWKLIQTSVILPPLRERKTDIPLLIEHYLARFNDMYQNSASLSQGAMEVLCKYAWPGNVRELVNTIERIVIMAKGGILDVSDLPVNISCHEAWEREAVTDNMAPASCFTTINKKVSRDSTSLNYEVAMLERKRIVKALKEHNFIQQKASRALGITPRQLGYRIKKYNINIQSA